MNALAARRRALVLTDEAARHPFRRSLPPHVCATLIADDEPRARTMREVIVEDWKGFLSTYCAALVVVTAFLA